ncbi:hypothetical protein [Frigoriflavimonas asaccharolytica]|uniref:Uncharacterized protein n=1 Tax=Frigoriflavimonas asaccharolytica TaxID=2735899 RepID=A0A8J8K8I2_9FLAO|nr:hypothetical protein [Frigoriflavimonas asaccharolytica]NRS92656.1 hypothetical protein [Frigoriflavimonas asaccharolytica]
MKKFVFKLVAWISLFLILGLCLLFSNKYKFYGNGTIRQKVDFYKKNGEKYNAIIMGSSRMYRHLDPVVLDSATHHQIKAYNMATGGSFYTESRYILRQLELNKNIKYVFFEIQGVLPLERNALSTKALYYHDLPSTIFESKYYSETKDWAGVYTAVEHYFINIFYLKKLDQTDYFIDQGSADYRDGYYPLEKEYNRSTSVKTQRDTYVKDTMQLYSQRNFVLQPKKMNTAWENDIQLLIKECDKRGVKLVLVSQLFTEPYDMSFLKKNSKTKVLDFTARKKFKDFYTSKNAQDNGHLNQLGARKFSKIFADSVNIYLNEIRKQ